MRNFVKFLLVAGAATISNSAIAAPLITDEELPEGTFITVGDLDWTWAAPVSSVNWPSGNILSAPNIRPGWRFATMEEFANRPDASAFLLGGVQIQSASYWNSQFDFINFSNGGNGSINRTFVADGSSTGFYEMWYVRDSAGQSAVPEPATWALMLLGFFGIGTMMRRRERQIVSVSYS